MSPFYSSFLFIFGALVGSFLNVCISRIPKGQSVVSPGARCPKCGAGIKPYDNIPILSFILLKGRCRTCKQPIDFRYWIVEALTGSLAVVLCWRLGLSFLLPVAFLFVAIVIVAGFIDLENRIIPNTITLPGIVMGLVLSVMQGTATLYDSILGILLGGGGLLLVGVLGRIILRRESMGVGDMKLAAMIGAFWGWRIALATLLLSFLSGAIGGIVIMFAQRSFRTNRIIPFGPFIAASAVVALFYGRSIVDLYLGYFRG